MVVCAGELADPEIIGVLTNHLYFAMKNTRLVLKQSTAESEVDVAVGSVQLWEYLQKLSYDSIPPFF